MRTISLLTLAIVLFSTGCKKETKPCPKGYEGTNCDKEITPTKMVISKLEITKIPSFRPDATNWDALGGKPDIYIQIFDDVTKKVIFTSNVITDHNTIDIIRGENLNIYIDNPKNKLVLSLYDEDSGDDEYMGGINFIPYTVGQKFPETINADCSGCKIAFNLNFQYLF